jgi:hypothetical protein
LGGGGPCHALGSIAFLRGRGGLAWHGNLLCDGSSRLG